MKKGSWIVLTFLIAGCFSIVFYFAYKKTRGVNREVGEIRGAAATAIQEYNRGTVMPTVHYPMNPLFYDKGEGVLVCYTVAEIDGVKYKTKFIVLVSREKREWKAEVVKVRRVKIEPARR